MTGSPLTPDQARRRSALFAVAALAISARGAAPAWADDDKGKKKGGGLSYIQLDPLTAALSVVQRHRRILSVECGLDVADAGLRIRAQQSVLLLRDAYLRWLTVYAASLAPQAPPNPDAIEAQMQRDTDRILGRPGARFVLGTIMVN